MRWWDRLRMRVRMLLGRGAEGARLDEELRFHLERQIAENLAAGMSAEEARCAALRMFGNPVLVREEAHATWSWNGPASLLRDFRYGFRTLTRAPGFAAIAILVLALGIGANVVLFTLVRSVLLKPLPFKDPDRLVRLYEYSSDGSFPFNSNAGGIYAEWRKQSRSFAALAITGYAGYNLSGSGDQMPENVRAGVFSSTFLPMLGVQPVLGRNFTQEEDRPSANPTVLLSWGLWKRRFAGDPAIVNQTVLLDARPYTVIGVMPAWFAYPNAGVQLWTPIYYKEPVEEMQAIDSHDFEVIGRLKPGITVAQAVSELTLITRRIHDQHLDNPFVSKAANARSLLDALVHNAKTSLYVLLAATSCLLLIACLNVANLLVARAAARRKESAIRTALGSRRVQLLRPHFMEGLLLSIAGGGAGVLGASAALQWLAGARHDMARAESIGIDWVVAVFALGLVAACAIFAGVVSAFSSADERPLTSLQESSRGHSAGRARVRLRAVLLTLEVSLTVVLLIGAGLLLKSYARLRSSDLGCLTQNVLKMDLDLPKARYRQLAQVVDFFQTLLARTRNLPGITATGLVFPVVPGDGYGGDSGFAIVEHPAAPQGKLQYAIHRWVDPGYFQAIGIPILQGHTFDSNQQPGHLSEVIITDAFARRYFPGEDPVGKHLKTLGQRPLEIVGVVGDTRHTMGEPVFPTMYFPIFAVDDMNGAALVIRSESDVTQFAAPVQKMVSAMDRDLPVSEILTMDQVVGQNTLDAAFNATLLGAFAVSSLLLAAVGLFGVISYLVVQRTSEIGIRMALGAQRDQVLRLMLADGLRPALLGLAFGLGGSIVAVRLVVALTSLLYETQPLDPVVFGAVTAMLLVVAGLACLMPAWRASRLDPMQALRTE